MIAPWDNPDFSDPRFEVEHVSEVTRCNHDGCDRLAAYLVDYTMKRGGWKYEYETGYCKDHLPRECLADIDQTAEQSQRQTDAR